MNDHNLHKRGLPEDLRNLEVSLDALGEQSRASAPDDLGRRIADEGVATITSPTRGHLRLSGAEADPIQRTAWRQHWRLAASIALLVVAVVAAINQNQTQPRTGRSEPIANAIENDWIDFETQYAADTRWDDGDFELLASELDDLELSFNTAWTLDENLNLNEGESL